ncbi:MULTISPECIES: hypothetical protein [unclassified Methylobacterium]|jgi:hypothetical protein|uniref:hypothetical protein n=1 Tax=unclassified Methylobacterium TaxID=2615210 RepID=UPI001352E3D6|nr:hypothetical protein [Methylobacterium sp. 2A]MWV22451.1 hypothetical protein [Methylobacterium sp. 2A]
MTTYTRRRREGVHLISEAPFTYSRESGLVDPAAVALMRPGKLVQKGPNGLVVYDGTALAGVCYGYPDGIGGIAYTARNTELKGGYLDFRQPGPTTVTGAAGAAIATAGNLSIDGTVIAISANETLAAVAAAIDAAVPSITATVVNGNALQLVSSVGGDIVIAGDAAVLNELGLTAGTTHGDTVESLRAADVAALAAQGQIVR